MSLQISIETDIIKLSIPLERDYLCETYLLPLAEYSSMYVVSEPSPLDSIIALRKRCMIHIILQALTVPDLILRSLYGMSRSSGLCKASVSDYLEFGS